MTPEEFWQLVEKSTGCWLWTGNTDRDGYGLVPFLGQTAARAHRVAYYLVRGVWPHGDRPFALHTCDTPSCVRVESDPTTSHVYAGTHQDNVDDRTRRGRVSRRKLTLTDAQQIRLDFVPGRSMRSLANEYNVSTASIRQILRGETYRDI